MIGVPHLKDVFYRMGLSDKDIVALSGGHTLVIFVVYHSLILSGHLRQSTFKLTEEE